MKRLIHSKSGKTLLEFKGKKTIFYSKILEKEMKKCGIPIPPGMRDAYGGKDYIFFGDKNFQRAFFEIYTITCLDPLSVQWQKVDG